LMRYLVNMHKLGPNPSLDADVQHAGAAPANGQSFSSQSLGGFESSRTHLGIPWKAIPK